MDYLNGLPEKPFQPSFDGQITTYYIQKLVIFTTTILIATINPRGIYAHKDLYQRVLGLVLSPAAKKAVLE